MTATLTEARDGALKVVKDAHDNNPPFNQLQIIWTDTAADIPKDGKDYVRATFRHAEGEQVALAGDVGNRRFERRGLLTLQAFFVSGQGQLSTDEWGQVMLDSLEGKETPEGIIWRNVAFREFGTDGDWFRADVVAEFEYDQIK